MIAIFGGGEIAEKGIRQTRGLRESSHIVTAERCDVRDAEAVQRQFDEWWPADGILDVVYTAGVSRPTPVYKSGVAEWRHEIETNLMGAYHVARAASFCKVRTLIFVASLAGLYGKPNHSGYSASKAGLISLVQSLALEGHNAYAISPGRVDTAMRERDYPGEDPRTRLNPLVIGGLVKDIIGGKYTPGDNLVIRMRGHEVLPLEIHRGDGWRERLKVGEPPTC